MFGVLHCMWNMDSEEEEEKQRILAFEIKIDRHLGNFLKTAIDYQL